MLDVVFEQLENVRDEPAWREPPPEVIERLKSPMPREGAALERVFEDFRRDILPYPTGNVHPRFFGWVHGSGTPAGALADLFAAVMNSNVGGRHHAAVYVERQVIRWFCDLFAFPEGASGILTTGTSLANFLAVSIARTAASGRAVRDTGIGAAPGLTAYTSEAAHGCIAQAFELSGLGANALRILPVDAQGRLDPNRVREAIAQDRGAGRTPFMLIATAGTVDAGAIDPLEELHELARNGGLWFHVDGAFGATIALSDSLRSRLRGIENADSIAFDFHKWLHVPYDDACLIVRNGDVHRATFASEGAYVTRMERGTAAGRPWFADYGPELSRGFRALKVWFTIRHFGTARLAHAIEENCRQAQSLADRLTEHGVFELAAPVHLNIVCFRMRNDARAPEELDRLNDELAIALQESGEAVVSTTTLGGRRVLRACITNQRTRDDDIARTAEALTRLARHLLG
ncbi:MAG: aminotransferase class V-fold PLP-dependent enzyme [Candidatus Eremiobacteraeota bacterium]|nr:aminotransferase class V-fold PLP-dependent enzyme [Candidatus Eremiobacteraeota bacterium]